MIPIVTLQTSIVDLLQRQEYRLEYHNMEEQDVATHHWWTVLPAFASLLEQFGFPYITYINSTWVGVPKNASVNDIQKTFYIVKE